MTGRLLWPVLLGLLVATLLVSLTLGRYPVSVREMGGFLARGVLGQTGMDDQKYEMLKTVLIHVRMPRILAAMLVGAALSVSGAVFQAMFINPLVSPGLLGVLGGASFGAAAAMLMSAGWFVVQSSAFAFGLLAVALSVALAELYRGDKLLLLVLSGMISGMLFTALLTAVKYLADPYSQLPAIVHWLMGGLSMVDGTTALAVAFPVFSGIVALVLLSGHLNVLTMGEEEARSLGSRVTTLRVTFILVATLISSLTVALGGIIGWVGLVVPHMGRMLVGPDNRTLLPVSALLGAIFLLVVDDISRLLFQVEIPIGITTALLGIPFFAVILRNAGKGWS